MNTKVVSKAGFLFLIIFICNTFVGAENKFNVVPKLYEEVGCTEIKDSAGNIHFKSFECPDFKAYDPNKCHLSGKTFNVGDSIEGDFVPNCRTSCKCLKRDEAAHIVCADIECEDVFVRDDPGCISIYNDTRKCCRNSKICDETTIRSMLTCEVEGKSYRMGQRIYPDNSCYECFCAPDYNNATSFADNSNCVKINCGMELELNDLRNGCVPIYWKSPNCCPIEYKCPSKDDTIESHSTENESQTCKFGDLNLKRGDRLKIEDNCLKCECAVPPLVTCIKSC